MIMFNKEFRHQLTLFCVLTIASFAGIFIFRNIKFWNGGELWFTFLHVYFVIAAALLSSNAIAGERYTNTIEFLEALPVSRNRIFWTKTAVVAVMLIILFLITLSIGLFVLGKRFPHNYLSVLLSMRLPYIILHTILVFGLGVCFTSMMDKPINAFLGVFIYAISVFLFLTAFTRSAYYYLFTPLPVIIFSILAITLFCIELGLKQYVDHRTRFKNTVWRFGVLIIVIYIFGCIVGFPKPLGNELKSFSDFSYLNQPVYNYLFFTGSENSSDNNSNNSSDQNYFLNTDSGDAYRFPMRCYVDKVIEKERNYYSPLFVGSVRNFFNKKSSKKLLFLLDEINDELIHPIPLSDMGYGYEIVRVEKLPAFNRRELKLIIEKQVYLDPGQKQFKTSLVLYVLPKHSEQTILELDQEEILVMWEIGTRYFENYLSNHVNILNYVTGIKTPGGINASYIRKILPDLRTKDTKQLLLVNNNQVISISSSGEYFLLKESSADTDAFVINSVIGVEPFRIPDVDNIQSFTWSPLDNSFAFISQDKTDGYRLLIYNVTPFKLVKEINGFIEDPGFFWEPMNRRNRPQHPINKLCYLVKDTVHDGKTIKIISFKPDKNDDSTNLEELEIGSDLIPISWLKHGRILCHGMGEWGKKVFYTLTPDGKTRIKVADFRPGVL